MNIAQRIAQLRQHLKDPLYRNSIILIINTTIVTGLGFFFWMVVARFYTTYEFGVGAAIISSVTFLAMLSEMGLGTSLIRFLRKSENPVELINSCLTLVAIVALVVSGIFVAGLDLWSHKISFIQDNPMFILAFLFFAVGWALSGIVDSVFIARRRTEFALIKNTIFSLLKIPLPIILTIFFHAFGIVSSWGVATGIALIITIFLFMPRVQPSYKLVPKINLSVIRRIWKYSAGNYLSALFSAALTMLLPVIIVNLVDPRLNAYFYVAWTIASLLFTVPYAVSTSLFAEGSHSEEQLPVNARRSFKFTILLLIPAIIFILLVGKWLLLLFGPKYAENALTLLWLLAFSSLFTSVNNIYFSILRVRNRVKELVILRGLAAIGILITSSMVIKPIGIVGIGYAWIGVQGLISIYVLLTVRSRYRAIRIRRSNGGGEQ